MTKATPGNWNMSGQSGDEKGAGSVDSRACAGSTDSEVPTAKAKAKSVETIVRDLLYPEGKNDTPQIQSPADGSEENSSDEEEWASKERLEKLRSQLSETRKFINTVVKQHAKDIDNLKMLARMSQ